MEKSDEIDLNEKRKELVTSVKNFFSSSGQESSGKEDSELQEKRKQLIHFVKKHKKWIPFILLALIIFLGAFIRVQNFWLLKDVTNGDYVSVDLDSHIYLKYAKEILETGRLSEIDYGRFVPFGAPTANYAFPAYVIYYIYKVMHFFSPDVTINYADIVYPIVVFSIGLVFFFLLVRKLTRTRVALVSTLFLAIMPAFLQRTVGGSSDHDAMGIMFMFASLYLIIQAWESKDLKSTLLWGALAGIATGLTGLSWGAWKFIYLIFGLFVLIQLFLHKIEERHTYLYLLWLVLSIIVMTAWVPLFSLTYLFSSITTGFNFLLVLVLGVDLVLFKYKFIEKIKFKNFSLKEKCPRALASIVISLVLGLVLLSIVLGPAELGKQFTDAKKLLLHPMSKDRWELTVAEQHQPYFKDWVNSFGPNFLSSLPLFYVFFLIGLFIYLYTQLFRNIRSKLTLTLIIMLLLLSIMFSRYSGDGSLNGTSTLSNFLYLGSLVLVAIVGIYYYLQNFKKDKTHDKSHLQSSLQWDNRALFLVIWLLFMLIASRGAIRLVFIYAPVVAALGGYGIVRLGEYISRVRNKTSLALLAILLLFVLFSPLDYPLKGAIPAYYGDSMNQAKYSGPPYNQQWQLAGDWVKKNIPQEAVFGHWWDYGYWVQNGWERASVLDGANKVKYWNFLMGRHVLAGQTQEEALEFLQPHQATHFLIVADEIGKYTAYSSIGSDENFDRYSWITTFQLNTQETQETRNATVLTYQGGYLLDDDFVWEGKIYQRGNAGIGAVFLPTKQFKEVVNNETITTTGIEQPKIALVFEGKRVDVPLNCIYLDGKMITFPGKGYNGCFRLMPVLDGQGQMQNPMGAGLFVSEEGLKALWVNLYVFEQNNPLYDTSAFKSVYTDPYIPFLAIVQGRMMGPIKIWEINYPEGFTVDEETKQRYLGGNELLPDYFFAVNE